MLNKVFPFWKSLVSKPVFIIPVLYFLVILSRAPLINFQSVDYRNFLVHWILYIRAHGIMHAYGADFSDYSPLYTYFLGIANLLFPYLTPLYLVKLVTWAGEGVAVYFAYDLAILYQQQCDHSSYAHNVAMLLLFSPSLIVNGTVIGQCDIWWTALLLAMVYYLLRHNPYKALAAFGLAISFKLQAIFLSPLLLVYILKRKVPWQGLLIIPALYILTCLPAWYEGRSFLNLLLIYWSKFPQQGINVPWMAANIYTYLQNLSPPYIRYGGLLITVAAASILAAINYRRWDSDNSVLYAMLLATLFAGLMPFLLPGMFNRYFFAADTFSFVLACLRPRWFIITVCFQYASLITILDVAQFPFLTPWIWPHEPQMSRIHAAFFANTAAIASLLWLCYRHIWKRNPLPLPEKAA